MTMPVSESNVKISRTQKKKAALALQALGERLVSLSSSQLAGLNLPVELHQAVQDAKKMNSHEARRRQIQYIGSLMRQFDATPVQEALERIGRQDDDAVRHFKRIEHWRDELVAGNDTRLEWLLEHFPRANREQMTRLVQQARVPEGRERSARAGRTLFRYLRELDTSRNGGAKRNER
jgi:ribosome-associated protein